MPLTIEFWHDRPFRLHDRIVFRARASGAPLDQDAALSISASHGLEHMTMPRRNQPRRTLLLTGASRGIGHATVKRFSAAGWRVITCSRHAVSGKLPVGSGARGSHPGRSRRSGQHRPRHRRDQAPARRRRTARAGQQRRDLAEGRGRQAARLDRHPARRSGTTFSR